MIIFNKKLVVCVFALALALCFSSCKDDDASEPSADDYVNVLTNEVDNVIIPTMVNYKNAMEAFEDATNTFSASVNQANLDAVRAAYRTAYLAYQGAAIHDYYATANVDLVETSNLFPVDLTVLDNLIENRAYNFNTTNQRRANGFPAIDFMLYGASDVVEYFASDNNRTDFLAALVSFMTNKAKILSDSWSGNLRDNFIENGGVDLGSSISVQLNQSLIYYEEHVRENKVGIPIGLLGPNDTPIAPDATKREAYYSAIFDGNDSFSLELVKATLTSFENLYLGRSIAGNDGQGYDDLVTFRGQQAIDADIKNVYRAIFLALESRTSIAGDDSLYQAIQSLVTKYKTDLFPILNVQDADGLVDGD